MVRTQGQARLAAGCRTAVLLSALGGLALLGGTQPAGAGIALTKHNLSGSREGPATAVCVFCHTPSGDPTAATQPLWNGGQVDDSTTYSMFDDLGRLDPNRDGVIDAGPIGREVFRHATFPGTSIGFRGDMLFRSAEVLGHAAAVLAGE